MASSCERDLSENCSVYFFISNLRTIRNFIYFLLAYRYVTVNLWKIFCEVFSPDNAIWVVRIVENCSMHEIYLILIIWESLTRVIDYHRDKMLNSQRVKLMSNVLTRYAYSMSINVVFNVYKYPQSKHDDHTCAYKDSWYFSTRRNFLLWKCRKNLAPGRQTYQAICV